MSGITNTNNWKPYLDFSYKLDSLIDDPKISLSTNLSQTRAFAKPATRQPDPPYTVSLSQPGAKAVPAQPTKSTAAGDLAAKPDSDDPAVVTDMIAAVTAKTVAEAKEKKLSPEETCYLFRNHILAELELG